MNASRRPPRRAIAAAMLLLATMLANSTATMPARAAVGDLPYRIEPAMTSSTGLDQAGLRADGGLLVWEDSRSGSPEIYGYDLDDQREFRVAAGDEAQQQPAVSGSRIVWTAGADPAQRVIAGIDLSRGDTFSVTETPAEVSDPVISGVLVVWRQRVNDGWDLFAKNVQSGETFPITADPVDQAYPSISGDIVVWQEYRDGSWDVARYDLKTRQLSSLAGSKDDETTPMVDGTRVVYCVQPATGGPPRLVLDDLAGGKPQTIVDGHLVMSPDIADGVVVWEDWRTGLPDIYAYDIAGSETFAIARSQQAYAPAVSERGVSWISRTDLERGRVQAVAFVKRLPTDGQERPAVPTGERLYIPETRHFISAGFKSYWQAHGGTELFGYPLSEEYTETDPSTGEPVVVQYFERVKLEYRASAPEDARITLARLGSELTQDRGFQPIRAFESTPDRLFIPETGHSLAFGFKTFWESNGGAALFGYPISEEITENGRIVQYFERARFELNPNAQDAADAVTLGLLGREALQRKGWLPAPPLDTTLLTE